MSQFAGQLNPELGESLPSRPHGSCQSRYIRLHHTFLGCGSSRPRSFSGMNRVPLLRMITPLCRGLERERLSGTYSYLLFSLLCMLGRRLIPKGKDRYPLRCSMHLAVTATRSRIT